MPHGPSHSAAPVTQYQGAKVVRRRKDERKRKILPDQRPTRSKKGHKEGALRYGWPEAVGDVARFVYRGVTGHNPETQRSNRGKKGSRTIYDI